MSRTRRALSDKVITPDNKAVYAEFVRFNAFPKPLRMKAFGFKNDYDFADHYHMSKDTFSMWKSTLKFWDDVSAQMKVWGRGKTMDVVSSLLRKAVRDGSAPEVKLWMQIIEDFKEKSESTHLLENREAIKQIQDDTRALLTQEGGKKK